MNADARIVVGYDGTPGSLAALEWAAKGASLRGAAVVATTIMDPRQSPRGVSWLESHWDEVVGRAREVLARWPEVPATIERHVGHVVPRLLESAEGGSMLVVGSHGHTAFHEMLLGSVSQSAARHAGLPVVVVRPPVNAASGRIVVGSDGSEPSIRALGFAFAMARLTSEKVVVLRAWQPITLVADHYGYVPPASTDTIEAAQAALGLTVDDLRETYPDAPVEGEIFRGAAERGLLEAADNASLVVVGSRGYTAVGEVLMGSVGRALLHRAHCPVAVIH